MDATGSVLLEFKPELNQFEEDKQLRHGLSAIVQIKETLWVVNDETISLERLSFQGRASNGSYTYSEHKQFSLENYLTLPAHKTEDKKAKNATSQAKRKIAEADIEGLDYKDGYLWLVGSHSLKRKKPDAKDSLADNFKALAKVESDGNRYLLARIPLVEKDGVYMLLPEVDDNGQKLTAGQVRGNATGNALTEALAQDAHLQHFLALPGKDNGLDIEGLAVGDDGRILLGLRGPVLRGWAIVLELQVEAASDNPAELALKPINPQNPYSATGNPIYRKHFLDLGGLGIRDLCRVGDDLLILAGPTMTLDGPITIFRWIGGAKPEQESLVSGAILQKIADIPYGQGKDQAEGMALFCPVSGEAATVVVVYDSADVGRLIGKSAVRADVFTLS